MNRSKLFGGAGRRRGTVILNWTGARTFEFVSIARSFREAAERGVARLRSVGNFGRDGSPAYDFDAYPIVYLYRHALELLLKAVILECAPYVEAKTGVTVDHEQVFSTHELDKLLAGLERAATAFRWSWNLDGDLYRSHADVADAIDDFRRVDPKSFAFRYPVDRRGHPSLTRGFEFDLFEFDRRVRPLLSGIEGLFVMAQEQMSAEADRDEE